MTGGFVKLHRCALDSWLWQVPAEQRVVAITLLLMAQWRPAKAFRGGRMIEVPRGSVLTCRDELAAKCGVSVQTVRTALKNFEGAGFLTSASTKKYTVISIVNFESYQGRDEVDNQHNNQESTRNQPSPNQELTKYQPTHYKEEEREEEKEGEEQEEEHTAPAVAGRVHSQPGLFAESAQEPRETTGVARDTGLGENAAHAPAGGLTKAAVIAELLHGTEEERQAAEARRRQGQWGRELQRRRKALGITADELAKFLPFGARQVMVWEKGHGAPLPEVQGQVDTELARIESGLRARAAAAVEEINAVAQRPRGFEPDSELALEGARRAWRWGWDVERFRAIVRLICEGLRDFQGGAKVRPATVFQAPRLKNAAEELDAGAVPHNGRQPLKGAALLDQMREVAADIRRDQEQRRRQLQ